MSKTFRKNEVIPLGQVEERIIIPISEYKELLILKGKYEELKNNQTDLLKQLFDSFNKGKKPINVIREILGLKPIKTTLKYHQKS